MAAAQIIAVKIITVGPFVVPASIFIYPFTLLLIDCIVEFFGKQEAHRAIGICFVSQVVLVLLLWLSIIASPVGFWELQESWKKILSRISPLVYRFNYINYLINYRVLGCWLRERYIQPQNLGSNFFLEKYADDVHSLTTIQFIHRIRRTHIYPFCE